MELTFLKRLLSRNVAALLLSTVTVFFLQALHAHRRHLRAPWGEVASNTWGCGTCSIPCSLSLVSSPSAEADSGSADASADTTDEASSESGM